MRRILLVFLVLVALLALAEVRLDRGEPLSPPTGMTTAKPILVYYSR